MHRIAHQYDLNPRIMAVHLIIIQNNLIQFLENLSTKIPVQLNAIKKSHVVKVMFSASARKYESRYFLGNNFYIKDHILILML